VLQSFKDGNQHFVSQLSKDIKKRITETGTHGQHPHGIVLGCIDSRVPIEQLFEKTVGDTFVTRIGGNYADPGVIWGIEYACAVKGSKVAIVLGHTDCGAVKAAIDDAANATPSNEVMHKLVPHVKAVEGFEGSQRNSSNKAFVNAAIKKNVLLTVQHIKDSSDALAKLVKSGEIEIVGAVYDVETGNVEFL